MTLTRPNLGYYDIRNERCRGAVRRAGKGLKGLARMYAEGNALYECKFPSLPVQRKRRSRCTHCS